MSNAETPEILQSEAAPTVADYIPMWQGLTSGLKALRTAHVELIDSIREKTPKAAKKFDAETVVLDELIGFIPGVKKLIDLKTGTIKELRRVVAAHEVTIADKTAEIEELTAEKLNLISFRRPISVFTGVTETSSESPVDTLTVKCDPGVVMSRIFIIVSPEAGVLGFKVFVDSSTFHVFLIHEHIAMTEIVEGRVFDVDNNPEDALKVYMNTLTCAVALADTITSLYGRYNVLPMERNSSAEGERVPEDCTDLHISEDAGTVMPSEEDGDEDGDDEEEDGDSPLDILPSGMDEEDDEDSDDEVTMLEGVGTESDELEEDAGI